MDNKQLFKPAFKPPESTIPMPPASAQPLPKKDSNSSAIVLIVIIIAIFLISGAAFGTFIWQHGEVKNRDNEIASLNSKLAVSSSKLTKATSSTGQKSLYLYSYGLKIPLSKDIEDLYFVDLKGASNDTLSFSTQSLTNADTSCLATPNNYSFSYTTFTGTNQKFVNGSPFGLVTIASKAIPASQNGTLDGQIGGLITHVNGQYIYYIHQQAACAQSATNQDLESKQQAEFMIALKDIQPIN